MLILHSFGQEFALYQEFASGFQRILAQTSPQPVEFFNVALETARHTEAADQGAFVAYVHALAKRKPDLVVTVGGPAARFGARERDGLFPSVPLLVAGVERRAVAAVSFGGNSVVSACVLDLPGVIENILRLLPDTTDIVVVFGNSPLSHLWIASARQEFARFANRVRFSWVNELSFEELKHKVARLPPHTAIFFGELNVDAAGVPHERHTALTGLHEVANAPIFSVHDTQLDRGIVGGPLVSISEMSQQAATIALRILNGEKPGSLESADVRAGAPIYDAREIERWSIDESRLPPGSIVLFRRPSIWDEYRTPVLVTLGILALQTALTSGLLIQHARRRVAEREVRALARRLLTAHEDERRHLARELHDDFSQRLARLAMDAGRMERAVSGSAERGSARSMHNELARLTDDVHALSYRLHPSILDHLGLGDALKAECEQFSERESIPAHVTSFEAPSELPPEVAVCMFRIAQEALRNVARHSQASRVNLAVTAVKGTLRLIVRDDGIGFVPAQRRDRSLGLASMRERASLVDGTLEIESSPGRGTTLMVSVPTSKESR